MRIFVVFTPIMVTLLLCMVLSTVLASVADLDLLEKDTSGLSYYELLGIDTSADAAELKKAYRSLALRYHPDKYGDESSKTIANALFTRIVAANDALVNHRSEYDYLLSKGVLDWNEQAYKQMRRDDDVQRYGRMSAYAMRAMKGDIDEWYVWVGLAASILCLIAPVGKHYYDQYQRRMKTISDNRKLAERTRSQLEVQRREHDEERARQVAKREAVPATLVEEDENETDDSEEAQERRRQHEERRKQSRKARNALRTLCKPYTTDDETQPIDKTEFKAINDTTTPTLFTTSNIEFICTQSSADIIDTILETLPSLLLQHQYNDAQQLINKYIMKYKQTINDINASTRIIKLTNINKDTENNNNTNISKEWSSSEQSTLARGMAKYPGGTQNRWERITAMINQISSIQRTEKEVLMKVKEDEVNFAMKKSDTSAFTAYLEKKQQRNTNSNGSILQTPNTNISGTTSSSSITSASPSIATSTVSVSSTVDEWSNDSQSALERALAAVSRDAPDRWDLIAAAVPGKTKSDCIKRFKEIKAQIVAAKNNNNKKT